MFLPQEGAESNEAAFEPSLLQTGQPKCLQPWCSAALASTLWRYGEEEDVVGAVQPVFVQPLDRANRGNSALPQPPLPRVAALGSTSSGRVYLSCTYSHSSCCRDRAEGQSCCCSPDVLCLPRWEHCSSWCGLADSLPLKSPCLSLPFKTVTITK